MTDGVARLIEFPGQTTGGAAFDLDSIPPIMTGQELADWLKVSLRTVERMRERKQGPAPKRLPGSRMFRYTGESVRAWWNSLDDAWDEDAV